MFKKAIVILTIWTLIFPSFSFGQPAERLISPPKTLEEIKAAGFNVLKIFPEFLKDVWQGFLGYCLKLWNFFEKIWNSYIYPFLHNLWQKTIGKEIRERKPVIEEEFKKEKQEVREEIRTELPDTLKSLWERFKELIK